MVTIHQNPKTCFLCNKKIRFLDKLFFGYDYEISEKSIDKDGITYIYVDKYYHIKCAERNKPK